MHNLQKFIVLGLLVIVGACTSGGEGDAPAPAAPDGPAPGPGVPPASESLSFTESSSLLTQGTFGASEADIMALENRSASAWVAAEFEKTPTYHLPTVLAAIPDPRDVNSIRDAEDEAANSFWEAAVAADDQLRQRMVFALSQILVVSGADSSILSRRPHTQGAYIDILVEHAFGNYRDLLEDVTYSVAMAEYLTYIRNRKEDPATGRVPDENYAREIMQLFTIGLVELNLDGTPRLRNGEPIETYTNEDVTGLSRVFTGLSHNADRFNSNDSNRSPEALYTPLKIFEDRHSTLEKSFLGVTIPPNTPAAQSIDIALDTLVDHPNTPPFISKQLIQRFVTSNPTPAYVERVATAFQNGTFTMANGQSVGAGRRGDLSAVVAAILLDAEARDPALRDNPRFGKIREPLLRFTHWARAFNVNSEDLSDQAMMRDASREHSLGQHPFRAPSVFNFYRPGYVAPGSGTGEAGLTAPELQITNATTIVGYTNFMTDYIFGEARTKSGGPNTAYRPDYSAETALAEDPDALVSRLDRILTNGQLSEVVKSRIAAVVAETPVNDATREGDLEKRVSLAILMTMTSPEYLVQR